MSELTDARLTEERGTFPIAKRLPNLPLAAATKIFQGAMAALNLAGNLVPASADPTLRVLGRSEATVDNSAGAAGDLSAPVKRGVFGWGNSAGTAEITLIHIGRICYAVDDQTVSLTNPLGAYPVAGRIYDVDAGQVFVEHGVLSANEDGSRDLFIVAGADLSSTGQNRFVALNSAGALVLAATAGMGALGVLLNAPANGAIGIVRRRGLVRMLAEEVITEGQHIAVAVTSGRAKVAVNASTNTGDAGGSTDPLVGSFVMGTALEESAGAGDLFLVDIHPMGAIPTTAA